MHGTDEKLNHVALAIVPATLKCTRKIQSGFSLENHVLFPIGKRFEFSYCNYREENVKANQNVHYFFIYF